jgi:hypothetical protein
MNGWLFALCLVALIGGFCFASLLLMVWVFAASKTRGGIALRQLILGLILAPICLVLWTRFYPNIDSNGLVSAHGLLFIASFAMSAAASLLTIFGAMGMLVTVDVDNPPLSRVTTTTTYHCPNCKEQVKPFDLPLEGYGTCHKCGTSFKV